MTFGEMAAIHAASFDVPRPWNAIEFEDLITSEHVISVVSSYGYVFGRFVADEAEILTLAVHPSHRNQGLGRQMMTDLMAQLSEKGAKSIFLEVRADNGAALALYRALGFEQRGTRSNYYRVDDKTLIDAAVLQARLASPSF